MNFNRVNPEFCVNVNSAIKEYIMRPIVKAVGLICINDMSDDKLVHFANACSAIFGKLRILSVTFFLLSIVSRYLTHKKFHKFQEYQFSFAMQ